MLGQMLVRAGGDRAGRPAAHVGRRCRALAQLAHVLDRHDDLDLERLADAGVDDGDRPRPPSSVVAAEEVGDLLERPLGGATARCAAGGRLVTCSSRSSEHARWAPRLVAAIAWISSMMTVSTLTRVLRTAR